MFKIKIIKIDSFPNLCMEDYDPKSSNYNYKYDMGVNVIGTPCID